MFGPSILRLENAMAKLDDPNRLERERRRFSQSPVSCRSGSTQFDDAYVPSPHPIADQKIKLEFAYQASEPANQFDNQVSEEIGRMMKENPIAGIPMVEKPAEQAVKRAWVEQGIWRPNWYENTGRGIGVRWKHQDPLENEGEIRACHWDPAVVTNPPPRKPQNDEERRAMERDRDASRPLPQFLYQVRKACDRLVAEHQATTLATPEPPNLGTAAYNEVKELWTKWGIWNDRWDILPGRTWKHEHPFEDMLRDELPEALPLLEEDASRTAAILARQAANQRPLRPRAFKEDPWYATSPRDRQVESNPPKSHEPPYPSLFGGDLKSLDPRCQPQSLSPTAHGVLPPPIPSLFGGNLENPEPRTQPQQPERLSQQASSSQPKDASHKTRGGRVIKDAARPRGVRSRQPARTSTEVSGARPVSRQSKRSPGRPSLNVSGDGSMQAQRGSRTSERLARQPIPPPKGKTETGPSRGPGRPRKENGSNMRSAVQKKSARTPALARTGNGRATGTDTPDVPRRRGRPRKNK